ncbi:MAG: hypothetical protein Q4G06_02985 [Clostridia bacterium]|nr:hypothetical protein [Clostridia bacterium]
MTAEIQNANRLYREQSDALKQIYRLKTQRLKVQDDTPYAQSLDGQIANLQTLIDGNRKLIAQMDQQAVARSRLVELAREEAQLSSRYGNAQQSRAQSAGRAELHQLQQAYRQLTTAYRQYNIAVKNGNETGKEYWSQSATQAMEEIQQIEQKLVSLNIEESVRKQILDLIQQAKNAEAAHQAQLEGTGNQLSRLDQSLDRMGSRLLQMASTMLVLRG